VVDTVKWALNCYVPVLSYIMLLNIRTKSEDVLKCQRNIYLTRSSLFLKFRIRKLKAFLINAQIVLSIKKRNCMYYFSFNFKNKKIFYIYKKEKEKL